MIEDEEQPQLLNTIGEYPTEEVGTIEEDIYVIGVESLNGKAGDLTLKSINGEDLVGTGNIALATAAQMQAETQAREQADAAETLARQQADQALQNTKQDNLTTAQLAAVNSGIDSTKVGQIATNATNITSLQNTKQDNLTQTQLNAVNSGIDQSKVAQIETNRQNIATNAGDIDTIESKIPGAATSTNQLTDKNYVDNAIATNTADYISDNGQPFQSLADLEAYSGPLTNNDYAFVVSTDSAGNLLYTRYKYNSTAEQWAEEYTIANPTFTSTQWAAIDSGVTATDVAQIGTNKSDITGLQNSKQDNLSSTQLDAVNSGIDATKVTQIATNTGDIATLQSGKQDKLVAGTNIQIAADGKTISATDTIYTAGSGLNLAGTEFSVDTATIQPKLTAGSNITITGNEISATDTTYTAGAGLTLTGTEFSVNDPAPSGFWTGNATESGTGTSITINNALATTPKDIKLDGDTEQISYTGKNLFSVSFKTGGSEPASEDNAFSWIKPGTRTAQFNFPTPLTGGTYTLSLDVTELTDTSGIRVDCLPTGQGITGVASISDTGIVTRTFTVPTGVSMTGIYTYLSMNDADGATVRVKNIQIEAGSTATTYEPYVGGIPAPNPDYPQTVNVVTGTQTITLTGGTVSEDYTVGLGSIELCKIGTYQDYIWKDGADWKIHKEIDRLVLNGTETWGYNNTNQVFTGNDLADYLRTGFVPICDYYTGKSISAYVQLGNMQIGFLQGTNSRTVIKNLDYSDTTNFKNWLASHNTTVYYVLATATDTQITDADLIADLEALASAQLATGQNTITSSTPRPNLDAILTIEAFNNNWNGLSQALLGA